MKELSEDEVEIRWKPPKMFQSIQLNYLVHCYRLNDQKIHTKTHELIAKKTSCVLDEMQKDVMYKISVWSIQATTQKKKGLPSQTKYTLREKGIYSKTVTIVEFQFYYKVYILMLSEFNLLNIILVNLLKRLV